MIAIVFAAALMAAAPPAGEQAAQTAAQTASQPAKAAKPNRDDVVCKKEPVAGTRLKKRICMTQGEWDQQQIEGKENLESLQRARPSSGQ